MDAKLFNYTNKVAYFLWDMTKHENALNVWYCAEDLASYLERNSLFSSYQIEEYLKMNKTDMRYIDFVRNIAFRIHINTSIDDDLSNWFFAEELLENKEWTESLLTMAKFYRQLEKENELITNLKSDSLKEYYFFNQKNEDVKIELDNTEE